MSVQNYISRQITVYKTDKKLIEFIDKLKPAPKEFYAHIHSFGDKDEEGVRQTSCIGIVLQDYSKGTGNQNIRVNANISPDEAAYILVQLQNKVLDFELKQEKIFGEPDKNGRAKVTKLRIIRAETGKDGKKRTYPWYVEIGNGTGVKAKTDKGGFYIKGDSYKEEGKVFININDLDFFKLMNRVSRYINAWENTVAPHVIMSGKQAIAEAQEASENT